MAAVRALVFLRLSGGPGEWPSGLQGVSARLRFGRYPGKSGRSPDISQLEMLDFKSGLNSRARQF
jgi:hypothetical protein